MSLVPWKRSQTIDNRFEQLQKEMNRMFGEFFTGAPLTWSGSFPALTTSETDKLVIVRAEVPGIAAKDVEVSIKDDVLTIKGEKKEEKKEEKENFYHLERSFGSFMRQVTLPTEVDAGSAESKLADGVLELRFPKRPEKDGHKRIEIKVQ